MVQVHALAAQHALIYRVVFIAFNCDPVMSIFSYHNATAHTTVTAGSGVTCCSVQLRYVFMLFQIFLFSVNCAAYAE
jgi:hypothetical protein